MKITKISLLCALSCGAASAYSLSATNRNVFGDPSLPIVDNAGNPLATGVIAVGYFSSDADVTPADFGSLVSSFNPFGSAVDFTGSTAGLFDLAPAAWELSVPSGTEGGQVGQNIYVVIGNASTLAGSDQLAVWKSNTLFGTENLAGQGGAQADISSGLGESLLPGGSGGPIRIADAVDYAGTLQLVTAIPEPSTSLLAALAGLGLIARRRR